MKKNSKTGDNVGGVGAPSKAPHLKYVDVVDFDPRSVSRSRDESAHADHPLQTVLHPGARATLRAAALPALDRLHARSLRPVQDSDRPGQPESVAAARRMIEEANRESSRIGLGPRFADSLEHTRRATPALMGDDARWVFAVRVRREVQGGHAAIVTPESRKRLLRLANRLGLRDFDANLVIAIVQDDARTFGGTLPIPSESAKGPLALVRPAVVPSTRFTWRMEHLKALAPVGASLAIATVFCLAAVRWLLNG